jgi:LuxR family transcriptional regulator, maltose regulon positive regulatory protein
MKRGIPIVSTKLTTPIVRSPILLRPRLLERIALASQCRITLLRAGPGYGKTTLLTTLTTADTLLVWYSLGASDRDLFVFLSYLVQGIRRHIPGFGSATLRRVSREGPGGMDPEEIAGRLVNDLARVKDREMVIVLDDYHTVDTHQAIRRTLSCLLTQLPANVHVVVSSRRATRLSSLPRLRMQGEVNDIGEADLRFTSEEIRELFGHTYDLQLSGRVLGALAEQTEGWIIGLQLAAQSLRTDRLMNADDLVVAIGANKRRLFEYLAEEVFRRQPAAVQKFLTESSILSTLSAESCDAILGRSNSASMLSHVEQNNLFAAELENGCWRYHHLFRDFLRHQLGSQLSRFSELHRMAAGYYERTGGDSEAVHHYLAAGDYGAAVGLISQVGTSMLRASRFDTLTHWITQIPASILPEVPELLFLQAQVFELQGHYDMSLAWAERAAEAFAAKGDGPRLAKVLCSRAYQMVWRAGRYVEADGLYHKALDYLGPENRSERADLLKCISLIHLPAGNPEDAMDAYRQALRMYEELGDKEGILATLINPGTWVYWLRGDFAEGLASLNRALALATELGSKHRLSECLGGMAVNLRYLDRCEEAIVCADKALALSREIGAVQLEAHNLTFLGFAYMGGSSPDLAKARRCILESVEAASREGNDRIRISALIGDAQVLKRMGDLEQAVEVASRLMSIAQTSTDRWLITSAQMCMGSALIGQDDERAEQMLLQARDAFQRFGDKWNLTCANYWLAVLLLPSNSSHSMEHLQTSLELARANGYDFWFAEERLSAVPLLKSALRLGIRPRYCSALLAMIDSSATTSESGIASPQNDDRLRIRCFGGFQVRVGDRLIGDEEWQRKKVKGLMKYLSGCPSHSATRDELVELFWGDLEPEAGYANLSRALHLLRRVLDPGLADRRMGCIVATGGLVRLSPDRIDFIDVDRYMAHVDAALRAERQGDGPLAEREHEAAEVLYCGDFLQDDPYEEWTIPRRDQMRSLHLVQLEKVAKARMEAGDHEYAIAHLKRVVAEDPAREDAHQLLMQCLSRAGRRSDALAQYSTCRRALKEELGVSPMEETRSLYDRLCAGDRI